MKNDDLGTTGPFRSIKQMEAVVSQTLLPYAKEPKARIFAFTQTFRDIHSKRPLGQFRETAPHLTKQLGRAADFCIVPEYRDTNGSIHYHGIVIIKDTFIWQKCVLPLLKNMGHILLKRIDNMERWVKYFLKDAELAQRLTLSPMPINAPYKKPKLLKNKAFVWDILVEEMLELSEANENSPDKPSNDV